MDYRWGDSLHASLAYVRVIGATSLLKENDRDGQLWGRVNVDF
jgi:hypothetical protein